MSSHEIDGHDEASGPPMVRRFKASGNPRGRPRGSKNRKTIVREIANELHVVSENGKEHRRTTLELVLMRLRNLALENANARAFDELHRLAKVYQPQEPENEGGFMVAPAPMSEEEWIAEQEKKNKAKMLEMSGGGDPSGVMKPDVTS